MAVRIEEFSKTNCIPVLVWLIVIPLLGLPNYSWTSSFIQTLVLLAWAYYGHVLAHYITSNYSLNRINPHIWIHHENIFNVPRWINLVSEAISNMFSFLVILFIQWLFNLNIFSTSIVFCAGLLYVLIHIADYSIIGDKEHREHHEFNTCNYAPSFMDILNNTRCGDDLVPYVDRNEEAIHGIAAAMITYFLKVYNNWN